MLTDGLCVFHKDDTHGHVPDSEPRALSRRLCWRRSLSSILLCGWPGEGTHLQHQTFKNRKKMIITSWMRAEICNWCHMMLFIFMRINIIWPAQWFSTFSWSGPIKRMLSSDAPNIRPQKIFGRRKYSAAENIRPKMAKNAFSAYFFGLFGFGPNRPNNFTE